MEFDLYAHASFRSCLYLYLMAGVQAEDDGWGCFDDSDEEKPPTVAAKSAVEVDDGWGCFDDSDEDEAKPTTVTKPDEGDGWGTFTRTPESDFRH